MRRYIEDELPLDLVNAEIRFTDEGVLLAERILYGDTVEESVTSNVTSDEVVCPDCNGLIMYPHIDFKDGKHLACPTRSNIAEWNRSHY